MGFIYIAILIAWLFYSRLRIGIEARMRDRVRSWRIGVGV